MVAVKRRNSEPYSPLPLIGTPEHRSTNGSFSFRDALESPAVGGLTERFFSPLSSSPKKRSSCFTSFPEESKSNFYMSRKSLAQQKNSNSIHWFVKLVYAVAAVSFLASCCVNDASPLLADIETEIQIARAHLEHIQRDYDKVYDYIQRERILLNKHKKTRKALEHEVRMIKEVRESSGKPMKAKPNNAKMIQSWLNHRKDGLINKIEYLQSYLQAESKKVALQKYGAGPHRVQITIDLIQDSSGRRQNKSFTVELAPLDWMPHSTLFFLDMVHHRVWDDTVFLHHEDTEHVIAAAPIDYSTQRIKQMTLNRLGWIGLGFPEYTPDFPHTKYTLGFSGQGPTFYINAIDNTKQHGPGGQGHHLLDHDADPCFASVVEGRDVVDEMVRLGSQQTKSGGAVGNHPWVDEEHTWTHIVSAEIVASSSSSERAASRKKR